jgi:hypothetical protein
MNSYLKELADLCGITKELTFPLCQAHLRHHSDLDQWRTD